MEKWNVNFHSLNEPYNDGLSIMSDFSELRKIGHCDYYQILCRRLDIRATSPDPETFFSSISTALIQLSIEDHSVNSMLQEFIESTCIEIDFPGHIINAEDRTTTVTRALATAFEYIMHSVKSDLDILNRQSSGSSGMTESPASANDRNFYSLHNAGVYGDTGRKFIHPFGDEVPKQRGSLANILNHSSRLRGFEDFPSIPKKYDNLSNDETILSFNLEGRFLNDQVCETYAPPNIADSSHHHPNYASTRFPTQALLANLFGEPRQDHVRFSLPAGSSSSILGNQFSTFQRTDTHNNPNNNLVGRLPVSEIVNSDAINNPSITSVSSNTVTVITTAPATNASRLNLYENNLDANQYENNNHNLTGRTRVRNHNSMIRRKRIKLVNHPEYMDGQILWPKGVYNTEQGAFRVQLNLPNSNQKFSRNVKLFDDAVWLYEIAILIADSPMELSVMIDSGNFVAMQSLELLHTRGDYYRLLGDYLLKNLTGKYLRSTEKETAILAYDKLKSETGVNLRDQQLSIITRKMIPTTSSSSSSNTISNNSGKNSHIISDLSIHPTPPTSTTASTGNVFSSSSTSRQSTSSSPNTLFASSNGDTRFPASTVATTTTRPPAYEPPSQTINSSTSFSNTSNDGKDSSNMNSSSIIAQPSLDDYTKHRHLLMLSEATCSLVDQRQQQQKQQAMYRTHLQKQQQQQQQQQPLLWSPDYLEPI